MDSFGTGADGLSDERLSKAVRDVFDFRPQGMIAALDLAAPVFRVAAAYGHFGREPEVVERRGRPLQRFAWEKTDRIDELRTALGI